MGLFIKKRENIYFPYLLIILSTATGSPAFTLKKLLTITLSPL
jgi:hypothetical protein